MQPEIRTLVDISSSAAARAGAAGVVLERARWASQVFVRYDRQAVKRAVAAAAQCAHEQAGRYAKWAVEEAGFGVAAHKKIKNELTAHPLVDYYAEQDFVSPQIDNAKKIVALPRPAGVIFALVPSTNPIATINFKVLLALMTRNAIVISPHPAVRECCVDAVKTLAAAAEQAGAPAGCIQVVEHPSIPLIEQFMGSDKTNLILATGGTAMVRAAYSSSNPAIGVGPGNAPVFVDQSADLRQAARRIVDSKSFDNSILCTNESVLISQRETEQRLARELNQAGAHICTVDEVDRIRSYLFHERGFNIEALGRDATWIAQECAIRVANKTRILVAPIAQIGVEEPLSKEKLCPVLAWYSVPGRRQAMAAARAILRLSGAGHSAAFHGTDEQTALEYAQAVECYRVIVNAPCSQGAAGFETHLAPTFTIGTGYFGASSIGENLGPEHLVHWTRMAYNSSSDEPFGDYSNVALRLDGALPSAPSDGVPGEGRVEPSRGLPAIAIRPANPSLDPGFRSELRRLIAEELRAVLKDK